MATGKTLTDMINRIVGELGQRTDLAPGGAYPTVITNAISDAITIYQKERFRFNELSPLTPFIVNTVVGQNHYSAADDARIPLLYKIDYINYLLGNMPERMERVFPEDVYLATIPGQQAGPPQTFAWDSNVIVIYPPPSTILPLTIGGYLAVAAPSDPVTDTTNPWMNDAERLIRSRAKYEIALHFTRNDKMIAAMSPDEGSGGASERYYDELKGEANKIRATSRIRAMRF